MRGKLECGSLPQRQLPTEDTIRQRIETVQKKVRQKEIVVGDLQNLQGELEGVSRQLQFEERPQLDQNRKIFKRMSTIEELNAAAQGKGEGCMICFQEFNKKRKPVQCQFCAKCCCSQCCHRYRANPQAQTKYDLKALICDDCSRQYMTILLNHDFYEDQTLLKFSVTGMEVEIAKIAKDCNNERQRIEKERKRKEDPDNLKRVMRVANLKKQIAENKKQIDKLDKDVNVVRAQVEKLKEEQKEKQRKYEQEQMRIRIQREIEEKRRKEEEEAKRHEEVEQAEKDRLLQMEEEIRKKEEQLRVERERRQQLERQRQEEERHKIEGQLQRKKQQERREQERKLEQKRQEQRKQQERIQEQRRQQQKREQKKREQEEIKRREEQQRLEREEKLRRQEEERQIELRREWGRQRQQQLEKERLRQLEEQRIKQQKLDEQERQKQLVLEQKRRKEREEKDKQMEWHRQEQLRRQREEQARLEEQAEEKRRKQEEEDRERLMDMFRKSTMSDQMVKHKEDGTTNETPERTVSISQVLNSEADILNFRVKNINVRPVYESKNSKSEINKTKDTETSAEPQSKPMTKEAILRSSSFVVTPQEQLGASHIDENRGCKCCVF